MEGIKIIEETQISPPPGSVSPTSLPCTFVDLMFLGRPPGQYLFFYQTPQPNTILPNLKHSLSLTLQHFYPLAGNLHWLPGSNKPELVYKDGDSVTLTVAESEFGFDTLSDPHPRDVNLFTPLCGEVGYVNGSSEKGVPLLAIQITFFRDKGICIGYSLNHVACDGKMSFWFMKSWASLYRSGTSSVKDSSLPFYDRSTIFNGLEKNETDLLNLLRGYNINHDTFHALSKIGSAVQKGVVQSAFTMSPDRIERLKHWVLASIRNEKKPMITPLLHLSTFSVTCAYSWVCLLKARWGQSSEASPDATEHLLVPVDARARLNPPVPLTYFGNCGVSLEVKAKRSELLGELGIVLAAKLIATEIKNLDVYGQLQKDLSYYISLPPERLLVISSSPRFGIYQTDFGWGRPKRAQITSAVSMGVIFLNDSPNDDGGVEIGFVCKATEFDALASALANSLGSQVM